MADIFGDGGLLAKRHQSFEFRRGQLEMAEIVEEAFAKHQHALIEAGTGTGKTLAYLSARNSQRTPRSNFHRHEIAPRAALSQGYPVPAKTFRPRFKSRADEGPQ